MRKRRQGFTLPSGSMHKYNISVVTRLNTTPSRPRVELWRNFRVKLEAHLEQSRSPWHQRVTRMIEGRGQTLSDLNHHEATGTRKEVIRQPLSPRFGCCGLSSVGYRRTSAAIRARGLHAPTAPKFMEITLSPKNGRPSNLVHEVDQSFTRS